MRVKTDAKRRAILAAAGEAFREQGFAGTSMSAVARRIGGSKATLYRYFSSKEALFVAVMFEAVLEHAEAVFDTLRPSGDLRRTLERFGASLLALTLSEEALSVRRNSIAAGARSSGLGRCCMIGAPRSCGRGWRTSCAARCSPAASDPRIPGWWPCTCAACSKPTWSTAPWSGRRSTRDPPTCASTRPRRSRPSCAPMLPGAQLGQGHAAVHRDRGPDHIVAGARGQVDGRRRHVLVGPDAAHGHAPGDRLAVVARGAVHVRGEGPRRDAADHDPLADQPRGHAAGQVDQAGLARRGRNRSPAG